MSIERSVSPYERFGTPTPVADAILIEHLYTAGETLSGLAHRYYGDWTMWRIIADRNNISDVRQLANGTLLLVPERPLEVGIYESF